MIKSRVIYRSIAFWLLSLLVLSIEVYDSHAATLVTGDAAGSSGFVQVGAGQEYRINFEVSVVGDFEVDHFRVDLNQQPGTTHLLTMELYSAANGATSLATAQFDPATNFSPNLTTETLALGSNISLPSGNYTLRFFGEAGMASNTWYRFRDVSSLSFVQTSNDSAVAGITVDSITDGDQDSVSVVPEPHEHALLGGLGLIAWVGLRNHRKKLSILKFQSELPSS